MSDDNLQQGFSHVFESSFESKQGLAEYIVHPHHVEYANILMSQLDNIIVIDYFPKEVSISGQI